jgi:hypothetical protein
MNKTKNIFLILIVLILLTFCTAITVTPINHATPNNDNPTPIENTDSATEIGSSYAPIHYSKRSELVEQWPSPPSNFEQRCTDCEFEPMHFTITP